MANGEIATAYLRIIPSLDGVQSSLSNQFTGAGKDSGKKFSAGFVPTLKGLLVAAGGVALAKEVAGFVTEGVKSLSRIETINAQTQSAIKATGGAANVSAQQIDDLSHALEAKTATEAESIQSGANLLLTFKGIRNEAGEGNAIFDRTTGIMVDMARAMGTDASGSAIQLGKALNDPVAGISALTRVGVTFTDEQKNLIASLVESGDTLGAQKIILAELESEFGGAGESYASTLAGQMYFLEDAYGAVQEKVASGLMPTIEAFVGLATDGLDRLSSSGALDSFLGKVNDGAANVQANAQIVFDIIDRLNSSPEGFSIAAFADELVKVLPQLQPLFDILTALQPILPAIADAITLLAPALAPAIPVLAQAVTELLPALVELIEALLPIVPPLVQFIGEMAPVVSWVADVAKGLIDQLLNMIDAFSDLSAFLFGDKSLDEYRGDLEKIKGPAGDVIQGIKDIWTGAYNASQALISFGVGVASAIRTMATDTVNGIVGIVNGALGPLRTLAGIIEDITGVKITVPSIPSIPTSSGVKSAGGTRGGVPLMAEGGTITRPGWAVVGEAGPEFINMNVGARVEPLDYAAAVAGGGGITGNTFYTRDEQELIGRLETMQWMSQKRVGRVLPVK